MIIIKHQGKTIPLEESFPIEIEYKGKVYRLIVTKNGGVLLNKA